MIASLFDCTPIMADDYGTNMTKGEDEKKDTSFTDGDLTNRERHVFTCIAYN